MPLVEELTKRLRLNANDSGYFTTIPASEWDSIFKIFGFTPNYFEKRLLVEVEGVLIYHQRQLRNKYFRDEAAQEKNKARVAKQTQGKKVEERKG